MKIKSKFGRLMLIAVLTTLLTAACVTSKDEPQWTLQPGDRLPEQFAVTMADGRSYTAASLRGRVAVITFFNTSCPDCQKELPVIQQVSDALADSSRLVMLCIAREEGEAEIERYWREHGLTLCYSPQPDRRLYNLFASGGIPRIYLVTPEGVIQNNYTDSTMPSAATLQGDIQRLLSDVVRKVGRKDD